MFIWILSRDAWPAERTEVIESVCGSFVSFLPTVEGPLHHISCMHACMQSQRKISSSSYSFEDEDNLDFPSIIS
ncbi:hypothetical protein CSUI_009230 [Cystoisospora suis]|uniref:Uncharacterized protein n=1 Tax=Cystoisospora suis TaxID=483139 RepID=A0A2C6KKF7_9APIC|nr:hypothetical protein CSUI_009230 [Cystoisospora suis]